MNVPDWLLIVGGCILLLPVLWLAFGWLAMMAFSSGVLETLLDWFLPALFCVVVGGCAAGGVWLIYQGVTG